MAGISNAQMNNGIRVKINVRGIGRFFGRVIGLEQRRRVAALRDVVASAKVRAEETARDLAVAMREAAEREEEARLLVALENKRAVVLANISKKVSVLRMSEREVAAELLSLRSCYAALVRECMERGIEPEFANDRERVQYMITALGIVTEDCSTVGRPPPRDVEREEREAARAQAVEEMNEYLRSFVPFANYAWYVWNNYNA